MDRFRNTGITLVWSIFESGSIRNVRVPRDHRANRRIGRLSTTSASICTSASSRRLHRRRSLVRSVSIRGRQQSALEDMCLFLWRRWTHWKEVLLLLRRLRQLLPRDGRHSACQTGRRSVIHSAAHQLGLSSRLCRCKGLGGRKRLGVETAGWKDYATRCVIPQYCAWFVYHDFSLALLAQLALCSCRLVKLQFGHRNGLPLGVPSRASMPVQDVGLWLLHAGCQ